MLSVTDAVALNMSQYCHYLKYNGNQTDSYEGGTFCSYPPSLSYFWHHFWSQLKLPLLFDFIFYFLFDFINWLICFVCVYFTDIFVISQVCTFFTKQKVTVLCYCWAWFVVWCLVFVACRLLLKRWVVTVAIAPEHSNRTVGCKKTWSQEHRLMSMRSVFMSCIPPSDYCLQSS